MSRYLKAEVTDNQSLHHEYNLLTLSPLSPIEEAKPGQFYMIGLPEDPLLKRPFSHLRRRNGAIQIFFRIRGKGTRLFRELRIGTIIELIGPLGRPYPLLDTPSNIIVAGGIGIASLYSLIEALSVPPYVFYGARKADELFFLDEIRRFSKELFISTDDGSMGKKGLVTDRLKDFLSQGRFQSPVIYACGPQKMLENVSRIAKEEGVEAFVSVEERMACGIGACLGCVVKTAQGYQRVCKEGPVFKATDLIW